MATRPDPYVKKNAGDIMLAADWNEMQVLSREDLHRHGHTGGDDAPPIGRAGIAPGAVDGNLIDPQSDVALKSLKVNGRVLLDEIDALLGSLRGLNQNPLVLQKDLQVGGATRLNAQVDIGGTLNVNGDLALKGTIAWGKSQLKPEQGGSIELGGTSATPGVGTPYIDFHFNGKQEDFNARIINDSDGVLSVQASKGLRVAGPLASGSATINGDLAVRAGSILLSLEGNGGGRLLLANNANDNRIYLEAFNRTGNGSADELLLTGAGSNPVPQITLVADRTVATGALHAGNSDLYFTRTDHSHSGFGNTAGFAAIENAASHDALMLLGRANAQHPTKSTTKLRMVKVWDFLDVNGEMRVTGNFIEVNGGGGERCYIGGDGAGNDVQVGSLNASVVNVSMWNVSTGWMALGAKSFNQASDLTLKSDVAPLSNALQTVLALRGVRYNLKAERVSDSEGASESGRYIGFVAQEVQPVVPEAVSEARGLLSVSYTSIIPLLVEAIKEQQAMIDMLRSRDMARGEP